MEKLKLRALTLLAVLAVAGAGCQGGSGAEGAQGPEGPQGPAGDDGGTGPKGDRGDTGPTGRNAVPGATTTGFAITVKSATVNADNTVSVRFTMTDAAGIPVDAAGVYSVNTAIKPKFSLAYTPVAGDGSVLPYKVLTKRSGSPTNFDPSSGQGTLVENGSGAGEYTYTFPASAAVDPTKSALTHTVWIEATRQTNLGTDLISANDPRSFTAVNASYDFVPGGGTATKRELVLTASCDKCHSGFKPDGLVYTAFHGGLRVEGPYCGICHNVDRQTTNKTNSDGATPAAASAIFVHRIHSGKHLQTANVFDGIGEVTYPQDLRNCDACHEGAAQGGQALSTVNRAACGSCHDYVDFTGKPGLQNCTDPVTVDGSGLPVPCVHLPGANTDDTTCASCHTPAYVASKHTPVVPPNPANLYAGGSNANTNAAYVAASGVVPAGATQFSYVVKSVAAYADPTSIATGTVTSGTSNGVACTLAAPCNCATNACTNVLRPRIVFKLQQSVNGAAPSDVVFNTYAPAATPPVTEPIGGFWTDPGGVQRPVFVNSPSVYFVYAVPQDGVSKPADFNAAAYGYIKSIWNGTWGSGTLTGPDSSGFYTATLTGAVIPFEATMLTGGVGYTYALAASSTAPTPVPPLTQTNIQGYSYDFTTKVGGLIVPARDVSAVATGYTGRRAIVDNARCNNCHGLLGVAPNFHAGQRNDGPTCAFCHNPNQSNKGWAGNAKDFIHALHAGTKAGAYTLPNGGAVTIATATGTRSVPYGWHALSATEGYWEVTFPGQHNDCEACHLPSTYDFSAIKAVSNGHGYDYFPVYTDALLASMLWSTEAAATSAIAATYDAAPSAAPYAYISNSPTYGSQFKFTPASGTTTAAAATTLVTSPITAACVACHDSVADRTHMTSNGGYFYVARSAIPSGTTGAMAEQCLVCHGPQPGAIAPIAEVHK